ncbi:hypothetical protein AB0L26_23315 [Streptomyces nondiastaticus]|uniref:hypothetical protein n=1 Tax=Streptomyces nondiastaticus TaxID=3154512 RepID=UPI003429AEF2
MAMKTLHAVERNRAEVNVAPLPLRLGTAVGSLFPALAENVQRRAISPEALRRIADAQRHKR